MQKDQDSERGGGPCGLISWYNFNRVMLQGHTTNFSIYNVAPITKN